MTGRMLRHVVRLAVATFAVAAAGVVVPSSAQASTCSSASGVSVVVDFHQLGGGVRSSCDSGGAGEYADAQFEDAGYTLTYVQNEPFVCQVEGAPDRTCPRTPPANAYWSLWWSDGKSGTWQYASVGVTALKVPNGGYVALSWQGQAAQAKPGVSPKAHATQPTSSPTTKPPSSPHPTTGPTHAPSSSTAPGAPITSASTAPTSEPPSKAASRPAKHHSAKPSKKPKAHDPQSDGSDGAHALGPAADVSGGSGTSGGSGSGGLPGWVAPLAVAVLFAGIATIALVRRKSRGGA